MESTSKQTSALELWLKDVQSYIYKLTRPLMEHARFSFHRDDYSYRRKNRKSADELSFIFLNCYPVNYRVSFILEIRHPEIRQVKETFMKEILQKESHLCSIILNLKDFPSGDGQQERIKDFSITNYRDLFMAGDWLSQTIQYSLIPLCDQLSSVPHMDAFFESKPEWSLDTLSGGNICTDLIVARLNRKRDFEVRYEQLMEGLHQRIQQQLISPESRQLLSLCYDTIKK
ncbi:MAG TPA: hypothetical protein VHC50_11455 [Puia sp.]|jgi:hypothetical protein|nr:hypothetical protein [Puia sp.]